MTRDLTQQRRQRGTIVLVAGVEQGQGQGIGIDTVESRRAGTS